MTGRIARVCEEGCSVKRLVIRWISILGKDYYGTRLPHVAFHTLSKFSKAPSNVEIFVRMCQCLTMYSTSKVPYAPAICPIATTVDVERRSFRISSFPTKSLDTEGNTGLTLLKE